MTMMCWLLGHCAIAHSHAPGIELGACARCGIELFRREGQGWQLRLCIRQDADRLGGVPSPRPAPPRRHARPRAFGIRDLRLRLGMKAEAVLPILLPTGRGAAGDSEPILIDLPLQAACDPPRAASTRGRARAYRRWWLRIHERRPPGASR